MIYIFYDGDNIGERFAKAYRTGDLGELRLLSNTLSSIHGSIKFAVRKRGGELIEAGGDEGLIKTDKDPVEIMNEIDRIWIAFGLSVSIGAGLEIPRAFEECEKLKKTKVPA